MNEEKHLVWRHNSSSSRSLGPSRVDCMPPFLRRVFSGMQPSLLFFLYFYYLTDESDRFCFVLFLQVAALEGSAL